MQVLIGIPTHKRPELLRQCLDSIAAQEGELPDISVFVADNDAAGKEGSAVVAEMAPSFRFPLTSTVVAEPGISAVRNAILAEAKARGSDFIAMIDDDETASDRWLAELLKAQKTFRTGVVGGPVTTLFPDSVPSWFKSAFGRRARSTGVIDLVDATSSVLLSCEALDASGWPIFDPSYGLSGGGDTEYFLRARSLGMTFAWTNEAMVFETLESERLSIRWVLRRTFRYGIIRVRLSRDYRMEGTPTPAWVALNLVGAPVLLILAVRRRYRISALRRIAYAAGLFSGRFGIKFHEYASRH